MSEWESKRFWTSTAVERSGDGYAIKLDERPLRTPGRQEFVVPTNALALEIANEWDAQGDGVDPRTMPMTRMANTAIDRVSVKKAEVADYISKYGETDLLCYRAESPQGLARRQAMAWDPILHWAHEIYGARLHPTEGIMPLEQPKDSISCLSKAVSEFDHFGLTALHDLVTLSGSLILGLSATREFLSIEDIWNRSRVDEIWQIEQWGADEEAERVSENRKIAFLDAYRFFCASQSSA